MGCASSTNTTAALSSSGGPSGEHTGGKGSPSAGSAKASSPVDCDDWRYAPRPQWLPMSGPGNANVSPECWAMTLRQLCAFVTECSLTDEWQRLQMLADKKEAGFVNLYQVCDNFVKPWTRGLSNSVALLLNAKRPLRAQIMISHAWGECLLQTMMAILGKCSVLGVTLDTAIWFCTFAQYQCGDAAGDPGPTVAQQLAIDPFGSVIKSHPPFGMLVVHTTRAELYSRLWCVFEVNEAMKADVPTQACCSMEYLGRLDSISDMKAYLKVNTEQASCFSLDDAAKIRHQILESGVGYQALDQTIFQFREASVTLMLASIEKYLVWNGDYMNYTRTKALAEINSLAKLAAEFIGYHCLVVTAEAAGQSLQENKKLLDAALAVIKFFGSDEFVIPPDAPPIPGFDEDRTCCGTNFNEIVESLQAAQQFPMSKILEVARNPKDEMPQVYGLLEMTNGGVAENQSSTLSD